MERKLLSLPSFFVLLLVAGIAFLAAPVVDVQAVVPTATVDRVPMTPNTGATPALALITGGAQNLFIIKFNTPVNVVSSTASELFSKADLQASFTDTSPASLTGGGDLRAAQITLTPIATTAAAPLNGAPAANQWFAVSLPVPANGTGVITLSVLGTGSTPTAGAFEDAAGDAWATAAAVSGTINYATFDNAAPTAAFAAALGLTAATSGTNAFTAIGDRDANDIFQIEITIADNRGITTSGAGAFVVASDVKLTTTLANPPATAPATDPSSIHSSWVKGTATATSVTHVVVIDPADGAETVKIEVMKDSVTDTATPANKIVKTEATVTLHVRPTVTISVTSGGSAVPDPIPATFTSDIDVTIQISAVPDGFGGTTGTNLQESDITVTNGTLQASSLARSRTAPSTATVAATYTAKVTLPADAATRKSPFTIAIAAGSFETGSGTVTNLASNTVSRVVTIPPSTTTPTPGVMEYGGSLSGSRRGFSFPLPAMPAPAATDGSDRFVVLAKAPNNSADNGISVPGARLVDIRDVLWQDLADFLAYDGGTINLIGPAGTVKNTLVISEIMWGGDAYLSDPTRNQWIELYNATTTKGSATGAIASGTWEIEFRAGAGTTVTPPANLSDSFSNRELGNAHWDIPNVSGGKYGQSGRTKLSPGTPGSLRDLVSMRRKIDYAKVEKTDHKTDATENRAEQVKGIPDGALAGSWEASTSRVNMSGTRRGTPGSRHIVVTGTTSISNSVVFNEIANRSNAKFDWIELYNPGSANVKINGWVLSKVTKVDTDEKLFKFESDENIVVPAKGFLLVVNDDPSDTALAAGKNVDNPQSKANGLPTEFYINSGLNIPKEKFLLILRTEEKLKSHEKIVDIAGHLGDLDLAHGPSATELWPLRAWKRIKNDDLGENDSNTWRRNRGNNLYHGDAWKSDGGFTGLGIDRNPESDEGPTSGTPGFDNGAIKDKVKDLKASDPVVISEIMFGRGGTSNRRNPQWIELYNPSKTQAVKLHNWRLEVQNITIDPTENLNVDNDYTLILPDKRIQPNQTLLIVSASAREATRDRFPADRVINIWSTRTLRETVEMTSARDAVLSSVAFYIRLLDPDKVEVDSVGNIVRPRDTPRWDLPGGDLEEGGRASMIRREGTFDDGTEEDAWISAAVVESGEKVSINELYYGDETDLGTPGYRQGGPVPVQLSSFYSKRNDAGAVIITWATESELDNAGFNILRSQSRTGEFTRINPQLIPGAGTTGEKNTYTWTDTSARPNVVYYYQIEDVSLDGEHRTLRTTRLRGYVGAAGKATTIWGELKSRD